MKRYHSRCHASSGEKLSGPVWRDTWTSADFLSKEGLVGWVRFGLWWWCGDRVGVETTVVWMMLYVASIFCQVSPSANWPSWNFVLYQIFALRHMYIWNVWHNQEKVKLSQGNGTIDCLVRLLWGCTKLDNKYTNSFLVR